MKPKQAVRQCAYLQSEGKALIAMRQQRAMGQADFFNRLRPYIQFHQEMKDWLQAHYGYDRLIMERVTKLPEMKFEDHSFRPEDWKTWLRVIAIGLLGPLAHLLNRPGKAYIEATTDQIHQNNMYYGSLEALLRNMPAEPGTGRSSA